MTAPLAQFVLSTEPPSVNAIYANKRNGGRMKTRKYAAWRKQAEWELHLQHRPAKPITCRVAVEIKLPMRTRGDAENRSKAACDALQGALVILNDRQCDPVTIGRADVPATMIILREAA